MRTGNSEDDNEECKELIIRRSVSFREGVRARAMVVMVTFIICARLLLREEQ